MAKRNKCVKCVIGAGSDAHCQQRLQWPPVDGVSRYLHFGTKNIEMH